MTSARVLFWTRRRSAPRGGDLVALEQTLDALRARGVVCGVSDDPAHDLQGFDLVHLYNLTDADAALEYTAAAVRQDKPLVVTPIYWEHRQWLDARQNAALEAHPEFFGSLAPDARALSDRVRRETEQLAAAVHQLVCQAAARIFILSQGEGALLARDFHAAPAKFRITYNGVDPAFANGRRERFAREFGLDDFVFSAARIEERKNTIGVIRAWRDETIPLVLAGPAPDPTYLEWCKREAGAHVHFLGELTREQVADACAAARVHVLASWWEEVGLAALEAGLAGCNLVLTQNGPAREYFGDGCWLCNPADPRSIHDAMRAAFDAPRQEQLAPRIRERFTWARAAEVLDAAYAEIAAQPRQFLPAVDASAWMAAAIAAAQLLHTRETYLQRLEAHARANQAWARELESIVAARDAERERLLKLPLARALSQRFGRDR